MARAKKPKYDSTRIVDAPEHHELARAMGAMTWGTWEHGFRPLEERIKDFCASYPPDDPVKFSRGSLARNGKAEFAPGSSKNRLARFTATDWRPGSLHALLARYGLKLSDAPPRPERQLQLDPFKIVARRRNMKLRVLHGDIDVSPQDMDAAKAEYLDRREKQQAAQDIRQARQQMKDELLQKK
jgi:hypothetical protein